MDMADEAQLKFLKEGVEAWNRWREEPVQEATGRDSSTAQADRFAGAKREEKAGLLRSE
jgi:hypothetical protein